MRRTTIIKCIVNTRCAEDSHSLSTLVQICFGIMKLMTCVLLFLALFSLSVPSVNGGLVNVNSVQEVENLQEVALGGNRVARQIRVCFDSQCNFRCRSSGKRGGTCRFSSCYCF